MLIAYSLFVLLAASVTIWIYQSIILPSIRQRIRFELFYLRDQTRNLVIQGKIKETHATFRHLHSSLNVLIKGVPIFDYSLISKMQTSDAEVLRRRQEFRRIIEESIPEVQHIYQRAVTVMAVMPICT